MKPLEEDRYRDKMYDRLGEVTDVGVYCLMYEKFQRVMDPVYERAEEFELQNGCDVRRFQEDGIKEISKESYNTIIEDDKRIVASRTEKSKKLIEQYLPADFENGWHRPFKIEE